VPVETFFPPPSRGAPLHGSPVPRVRAASVALEASFLSEMLKAAGFGEQINGFSGGTGEDQFASFHRDAIAHRMAEAGGIGIAEHVFRSMMEAGDDE